jgi:hypothetical protein
MINSGWIVTATDYYDGLSGGPQYTPYTLGKIEAANSLDLVRAASFLLTEKLSGYPLRAYDLIAWGHSQGGHAALWTAQLTTSYLKATSTPHDPPVTLSGVAAEAPAGNFITFPGQAGTAPGYGLLDWVMHTNIRLTGLPTSIAAVAFFNSYLLGPWSGYSEDPAPSRSEMPAYPATGSLQLPALLTPQAITALPGIADLCWTSADAPKIVKQTAAFTSQPFYLPSISNGATINGFQHGNLDHTCASDPPAAVAALCSWLTYNNPGPLGTSGLSKLPVNQDGVLVPVMIANGSNDEVVHCVAAAPQGVVPDAKNCAPTALYGLQAGVLPARPRRAGLPGPSHLAARGRSDDRQPQRHHRPGRRGQHDQPPFRRVAAAAVHGSRVRRSPASRLLFGRRQQIGLASGRRR